MPSKPKKKSFVWKFFTDSNGSAKCKMCQSNVKTSGNTTNLMNHLKRNHLEMIRQVPAAKKMRLDSESNTEQSDPDDPPNRETQTKEPKCSEIVTLLSTSPLSVPSILRSSPEPAGSRSTVLTRSDSSDTSVIHLSRTPSPSYSKSIQPKIDRAFQNVKSFGDAASIYVVPDDDYGYWYSDNSNASEELPFHTVSWDFQNSKNIRREKSSEDICMLCFTNERTHIFVPCGHLACCTECIERLECNRCPVCNTITYENCLRVKKP